MTHPSLPKLPLSCGTWWVGCFFPLSQGDFCLSDSWWLPLQSLLLQRRCVSVCVCEWSIPLKPRGWKVDYPVSKADQTPGAKCHSVGVKLWHLTAGKRKSFLHQVWGSPRLWWVLVIWGDVTSALTLNSLRKGDAKYMQLGDVGNSWTISNSHCILLFFKKKKTRKHGNHTVIL